MKLKKMSFSDGFTLFELLIVIAIIGLLGGMFITFYPASQKRARDARRQSDIKQYQVALEQYANKNAGNYIVSVAASAVSSQCSVLGLGTSCPDDPTTSKHYQYIGSVTNYVIWAQLEASTTYFITCSNGKTGNLVAAPTSTTCPL